ncbi:MAG TPA: uroporphyrinogen-III synthase [Burkholderiales bacterium]|nr:uroporphyrinogen-III synthase [Burkholderiales bacterium]
MTGVRGELEGIGVLITRPRTQTGALASAVHALGGRPVLFPGVEIVETSDAALDVALDALRSAQFAVFVSPNAARIGMQCVRRRGGLPVGIRVAAVGPGTAQELKNAGLREIIMPRDGYDSEALASHPALVAVEGLRIVIFRGEGGRQWLAERLRARGAQVVFAQCYRRERPAAPFAALDALIRGGDLHAWTATSAQIVDNLFEAAGADAAEWLRRAEAFVSHPRIAARAFSKGARAICVTAAGDAGLVAGLRAWFGRLRPIATQTRQRT